MLLGRAPLFKPPNVLTKIGGSYPQWFAGPASAPPATDDRMRRGVTNLSYPKVVRAKVLKLGST